jgi:hypothetical protein
MNECLIPVLVCKCVDAVQGVVYISDGRNFHIVVVIDVIDSVAFLVVHYHLLLRRNSFCDIQKVI